MKIAFTGTREGMSKSQKKQLTNILLWLSPDIDGSPRDFHHGDAVGADTEAKNIAWNIGYVELPHPAGKKPLKRNREIISKCELLIAAPRSNKEELRSGTWATIRYARAKRIPVIMLSR